MFRILAALILAAFAFAAQAAVDANKANQAELETVKGIGPGLSSKILDARKAGAFKDWNDLVERVGGVGPGNAAKFSQAGLTVNDVAYSAAPGRRQAGAQDRQGADAARSAPKARRTAPSDRRGSGSPVRSGAPSRAPSARGVHAGQPKKPSTSSRRAATSASPSAISSRV